MQQTSLYEHSLAYLEFARYSQRLAKTSMSTYTNRLRRFLSWAETGDVHPKRYAKTTDHSILLNGTTPVDALDTDMIERYRDALSRAAYRPRSVRAMIGVVSTFADWLVSRKIIASNPCHGIVLPRRDAPQRTLVRSEHAKAVLDACASLPTLREQRLARGVVSVLVYTALRRAEILDLRVCDMRLQERYPFLVVANGKGSKRRQIFLHPDCIEACSEWLSERETMNCRHDYFFAIDCRRRPSQRHKDQAPCSAA